MIALVAAFVASLLCSLSLERWPPRAPTVADAPALLIRVAIHAALFLAVFSFTWRPWHAAFVVSAASFLFGVGDATKRRILGEPLTFSDFALVRLAVRHPRLYYAERLAEPRAILVFATVAVATAVWFWVEPAILPAGHPLLVVLPPVGVASIVFALKTEAATALARPLVQTPVDAARDVDRFGLVGSMAIHWLVWRRQERPSTAAARTIAAAPALGPPSDGPQVIVAIQCESFVDIANRGENGPALPHYQALCDEALAWGRCTVPADGAYTMRSEFGFLTGLPAAELGLDCFDPYLTAERYAGASLALRLAKAGWRTVFLHPYDRRFFERDRLMPTLGFERFLDQNDFAAAEHFGPYVADAAVADAVIAEANAATAPTFIFVVTIENHGPWGPGRLPATDDGAAQYGLHLRNADRMIGRIAGALAELPGGGALCVYGDHVPARTILPGLESRGSTDYALWDSRRRAARRPPRKDIDVSALSAELVNRSLNRVAQKTHAD